MKPVKLTRVQEKILKSQVFDATHPGPVLRDFHVVLDFVGVEGVKTWGKHHLLPVSAIPTLDEKLSHPLRLPLQRPQLKSHPYLQGLHLLLRASGLTRVEEMTSGALLKVDALTLEVWNRLNPTEQYFTLLEAWLLRGAEEMVGKERRFPRQFLADCLAAWRAFSRENLGGQFGAGERLYVFSTGTDLFPLALMDLFGFLEIQHPATPTAPWTPVSGAPTLFSTAIFALLNGLPVPRRDTILAILEPPVPAAVGSLQPLFAPYFPEWRNNLVLPDAEAQDGIFVFKVTIAKRKMWRLVAVSSEAVLDELAATVLNAVDFSDDHLYEFIYCDRFGREVNIVHPAMEEKPATDEVRIRDLPLRPGEAMRFHFDFGDDWMFTVKLERIDPPNKKMKRGKVLESHGKAPPQYRNWDEDED